MPIWCNLSWLCGIIYMLLQSWIQRSLLPVQRQRLYWKVIPYYLFKIKKYFMLFFTHEAARQYHRTKHDRILLYVIDYHILCSIQVTHIIFVWKNVYTIKPREMSWAWKHLMRVMYFNHMKIGGQALVWAWRIMIWNQGKNMPMHLLMSYSIVEMDRVQHLWNHHLSKWIIKCY